LKLSVERSLLAEFNIRALAFLWAVTPIRNGAKVECRLNATVDIIVLFMDL